MTIRTSGITAAQAAIAFFERLTSLQHSAAQPQQEKIGYYLKGIRGAVDRIKAALDQDAEEALGDALLGIPGTARDFDAIDFNPAEFVPSKDLYKDVVRKKAIFFMDLDPSLRP